ncbi:agmatine deiminase family protein [Nocardia brasiliensis]|uniref:agmatine deiminase family protein n=1 Tax=Nocardia brasiliensis TaxID=37326 RepID=UPI002454E3BE|nr:agmatine deiminase family protein [Nocardia brasiliensis]
MARLHFDYSANPWWKWRYTWWLAPELAAFYPAMTELRPPATGAAMARWLHRWRLLPPGVDVEAAAGEIARSTVPILDIPSAATPSEHGTPLRLPAEWEPVERVLVAWPYLFPGLWPFHQNLVRAIAATTPVTVIAPTPLFAAAVALHLPGPRIDYAVARLDDIWIRDYGPLVGTDDAGRRVAVDTRYRPPPAIFTGHDDSFPGRWAAANQLGWRHLPLRLDGGNLWSDGQGTILTTSLLFHRNRFRGRARVRELLSATFDVHNIIELPPLKGEFTGHVDLIVKPADGETVLATEPGRGVNRARRQRIIDILRHAGYRVVELPYLPAYLNWQVPVWRSYTNALTSNGTVFLPMFDAAEADRAAVRAYQRAMPDHHIVGVPAGVPAGSGGTIHCLTMQIPAPSAR